MLCWILFKQSPITPRTPAAIRRQSQITPSAAYIMKHFDYFIESAVKKKMAGSQAIAIQHVVICRHFILGNYCLQYYALSLITTS